MNNECWLCDGDTIGSESDTCLNCRKKIGEVAPLIKAGEVLKGEDKAFAIKLFRTAILKFGDTEGES